MARKPNDPATQIFPVSLAVTIFRPLLHYFPLNRRFSGAVSESLNFRNPSIPETIIGRSDTRRRRLMKSPERAGIERLKPMSRLAFSPETLLAGSAGSAAVARRSGGSSQPPPRNQAI
jgi:hypothetical protein